MDDIQFDTKVWEGDYRTVLDPARLEAMVTRNRWEFASRLVVINNVERPATVSRRCRRLVRAGVIDDYVVAAEHAAAALERVGLRAEDLGAGYRYSIAELVALHVARTGLALHFSGDSMLTDEVDWVGSALDLLRRRPEVAAVNLVWNGQEEQVRDEAVEQDGEFWLGPGFSDQMYLVRTADLTAPVYGERHPASQRYPEYGGELFEKRVDSWMRNRGLLRATSTRGAYRHENIVPRRTGSRRVRDRLRRVAGPGPGPDLPSPG